MHFGFSYVGLIFLLMLFVPNFFWTKHKPEGYDEYAKNENKLLLLLERIGEVAVSCLVLIFSDFNVQGLNTWLIWLAAAFVFMVLYEVFWVRYFRSEKTMKDFYRSLLGIPVAGATLPVIAVLLIAVYGKNPFLFAAGIVLGIGHIGIHLMHRKEVRENSN
jgi:cytochrome bd-type quinol oxidase subunit 2